MPATVTLERVTKSYDGVVAVDALSFSIPSGQMFGLLGPNGAGKTSTIRMLVGITIPDSGSIALFGNPLGSAGLARIGYLPEERGLYRRMRVGEQLVFLGALRGLSARETLARCRKWGERLEIAAWFERKVDELSKGMQQKVQFIATLINEPEFLIMDEPFTGLDPIATNELKDILADLKREGRTILFSTHNMAQVERLCDSICLMNRGRALLAGDLREIRSRAGKRSIVIESEGGAEFLKECSLVASFHNFGTYVEIGLKDGNDPQELLRLALDHGRVTRFELSEPSLEQIFIELVRMRQ
ncbi:MAG TPA: ATP-binding cassette domain-containing protein [Candidatus Binataceae bacterium]|nr:ATP-binding cassette domain-containing protein [Candidatus Binataceae bacterium]